VLDKKSLSERDICTKFITPVEIIRRFGGKARYLHALKELETQLYLAA